MTIGQLAGRHSLPDIVESISTQTHRIYHLGSAKLSRSNLSSINEEKPYTVYEALFGQLLKRCQVKTPRHNFRFNPPLYSLNASPISLCLSAFPWAKFRSTKGAIKLHIGLNHDGYLPEFVMVTEGKNSDIEVGGTVALPKGSIVAIDRGYNEEAWFNLLIHYDI